MRTFYCFCLILLTTLSCNTFAGTREISITIDDLPLVGSKMNTPANQKRATDRFMNIIRVLKEYQVPATGFVIGRAIDKGQWEFLEEFKNAGFIIGNHTYSHGNLNVMSAEKYIADIDKADKILTPLFSDIKFFRYPYLAEGNKNNKRQVLEYLSENNYVIAPVTIDSKDFRFNEELYKIPFKQREQYVFSKMKPRYLNYIWKQTLIAENQSNGKSTKQILLLHSNLLNSYLLEDILKMYKDNGYKFISLAEALENPAPEIKIIGETHVNEPLDPNIDADVNSNQDPIEESSSNFEIENSQVN